jgi:hypothetical protein
MSLALAQAEAKRAQDELAAGQAGASNAEQLQRAADEARALADTLESELTRAKVRQGLQQRSASVGVPGQHGSRASAA